jgi:aminobenzoyl-glutamate utilization protein B
MRLHRARLAVLLAVLATPALLAAQDSTVTAAPAPPTDPRIERLKAEALTRVDARAKMIQEMVDQVYSFGELGMQEFETSRYLTGILRRNGFTIDSGTAGMPTAWVARWGSGKPVISLGSDIDGIPQSSQAPGVGFKQWQVPFAPGHGEGHNSGQAVNIAAALVVKEIMQRERMQGTLVLWPGVAEEQMAGKAHLVRAGVFRDVDVTLFTHVSSEMGTSWGQSASLAMVSAEFRFRGQTAHAAGAPWRGKSALDAVMLMAQGWEFHREHMEPGQRSHYVVRDGGDQPNVVPQTASIWFYFRERDYERVQQMFDDAKRIARGAAQMADVQLDTVIILGSGWAGHFNRPVAEAAHRNIQRVGLPTWDSLDITLAKGLQAEMRVGQNGLDTLLRPLAGPVNSRNFMGGGSDDIGDVSWNVPTITLRYPSNIPGAPGHNWANGIAMATPIAHKGAVAGAKVQALTLIDLMTQPQLIAAAHTYFDSTQTREIKYKSFLGPNDGPPTFLNADIMARFRPEMRKYYYDPARYRTYLEQLGIRYPTVRANTPQTTQPVP